jgi:UDP-N-acetylmuramoyl-tripeptide--D-alanyl-D-alanine ligase
VAACENRRLVVVLGEMRELGALSVEEHDKLGALVAKSNAACVIGVGGDAERIVHEAARSGKTAIFAPSVVEASPVVLQAVKAGDLLLVKGSRGVATEKIVQALVAARGPAQRGGAA